MAGASALTQAITIIGGFVLARLLGVGAYGVWKTVQLGLAYTAFANLGATFGLARACPAIVSRGQWGLYRRLMGTSLVVSWLIGTGLAVVLALWALSADGLARMGLLALAALAVAQPLYMHGETALAVEKRFGRVAGLMLGSTIVRVGLSIAAALLFGIVGVLAVFIVVFAAMGAWMWRNSSMGAALGILPGAWRRLVRVGLPITLLAGGELLLATTDKWLVIGMMGAEAMSLYQMAVFPLPFLMLIPLNLRQVSSIDIYDKFGQTRRLAVCRPVFRKSVEAISLSTPWLAGGIFFGMPWLVDWLLPDFRPSIPVLQAHAILCFPLLACQTAFAILIVARRQAQAVGAIVALAGACSAAAALAILGRPSLMTVLCIFGAGWVAFGAGVLYGAERLMATPAGEAMRRAARVLGPMAFLAVELPVVSLLLAESGLRPHGFPWAVAGGVVHTLCCAPMLWTLERRTGAVGFLARRIGGRLGLGVGRGG